MSRRLGGHHARPEQEGPVVHGHEGVAGRDEGASVGAGAAGNVLAERVDGEDAEDAHEDHGGLEDACRHETKRGPVAVALGDRVEGDGGDDASEAGEDLEEGADRYAGGVAVTEDEVGLGEDVGQNPNLTGIEKTKVAR